MIDMVKGWFHRHFSNPQVVILALLLVAVFATVIFMGDMLLPLLIAVVTAYLLEALVQKTQKLGTSRKFAANFVFIVFLLSVFELLIGLGPLITQQIISFVEELPSMITRTQQALVALPDRYPTVVSHEQLREIVNTLRSEITKLGQSVLTYSISSVQGLIKWAVYIFLIAMLIFFFLNDKKKIANWFAGYMPKDRGLVLQVWADVDLQIGNYVRGKFIEIIIVGVASWVAFALLGLNYAILLGLLVGLSVLVPYVGATVVTIPVALVAFFQWGWSTEFFYLMLAYGIIQAIDGNVIVPLLFSEAVNLHPVAILIAIIVFGGFWGFWGVFFAIPLATLVKAILDAWPDEEEPEPANDN